MYSHSLFINSYWEVGRRGEEILVARTHDRSRGREEILVARMLDRSRGQEELESRGGVPPGLGDRGSVLGIPEACPVKLTGATIWTTTSLLSQLTPTCRKLARHGTSVRSARPLEFPDVFRVGDSFDIQAPAQWKGVLLLAH